MKNWLKDCNYPDSVINQSFYNAKSQGSVPFTDNLKSIPFVTTSFENDNEPYINKGSNGDFNVTMESDDGAEVSELAGLFMLNELSKKFDKDNIAIEMIKFEKI